MCSQTCFSSGPVAGRPRRTTLACLAAVAVSLVAGIAASPASAQSSCVPTATLVNPCRPWLGAYGHGYPQVKPDLAS